MIILAVWTNSCEYSKFDHDMTVVRHNVDYFRTFRSFSVGLFPYKMVSGWVSPPHSAPVARNKNVRNMLRWIDSVICRCVAVPVYGVQGVAPLTTWCTVWWRACSLGGSVLVCSRLSAFYIKVVLLYMKGLVWHVVVLTLCHVCQLCQCSSVDIR